MPDTVKVDGERELRRLFRKLADDDLPKALKKIHLEAAETVAARARTRVPRRSGRLGGTIRAAGQAAGAVIRMGGAAAPYAGWIDYGGTIQPRGAVISRPYIKTGRVLYPALREARPKVTADYEKAVERLCDTIR